jgi:bacterioferritin-associated ferredoxin
MVEKHSYSCKLQSNLEPPLSTVIVCICHCVSDRDIRREVSAGTQCFELLQVQTRVASSCGNCLDCAREVFDSACATVRCVGLGTDSRASLA